MTRTEIADNPLLTDWNSADGVPPFDRIRSEDFRAAYARALAEHEAENAAIAADPAPPSFANTIAAMEKSGRALTRISNVFHVLVGAHSNDALLTIEREIAPQIARHYNAIHTNAALFRRIDTLSRTAETLGLSPEQKRVLERYHITFRRAGAGLDEAAKKRLAEIIERLAALGTAFSQNVLADEQAFVLSLHDEAELAGLPDFMREAMRADAKERGLDDAMGKTPEAVRGLLDTVWTRARQKALGDRDDLQSLIAESGGNFKLAPWDWRYYAEKLRQKRCDFDEAAVKPYLSLERMIEAAFYTAGRLFGLSFRPRADVPVWHPDVRVWEVRGRDDQPVGLFFGDYFARASKRSGAWMMSLRDQEKLAGEVRPHIVNVCNFAKAADGEPTLLSFDDAHTLFHEFGHALHGLLSNVTYPEIAGTNVATDFVELPSQLYEHWLEQPDLLRRFALHYQTREPMPEALLQRLIAARNFNRGFATVEYVACALVDLDFHSLPEPRDVDPATFEKNALSQIGMPDEIAMRHRPPHFAHIFAGGGYAAGYYSYMWSEVLDADAFEAFEETGDVFDAATAKRLHDFIYSAGGARDPAEAYKAFRGRLPSADALLRKRGFAEATGVTA